MCKSKVKGEKGVGKGFGKGKPKGEGGNSLLL